MVKAIQGDAWIDEKFVRVTFIKARDCDFDKANFEKALQSYDDGMVVKSKVCDLYMKHNVGTHHDYGKGFWEGCHEGTRGAVLFFYAQTGYKE